MGRAGAVVGCVAGVLLAASLARADDLPSKSGVTGGVGLGLSTEGVAGEAHVGYLIAENFAIGLELGGFAGAADLFFGSSATAKENVGSTVFGTVGVQWWPARKVWIGAGGGPVRLGIYRTDPTGTHETDAAWIPLGVGEIGWEIRRTSRTSIDLKLELFMAYDSTRGVLDSVALVAGFNLF